MDRNIFNDNNYLDIIYKNPNLTIEIILFLKKYDKPVDLDIIVNNFAIKKSYIIHLLYLIRKNYCTFFKYGRIAKIDDKWLYVSINNIYARKYDMEKYLFKQTIKPLFKKN